MTKRAWRKIPRTTDESGQVIRLGRKYRNYMRSMETTKAYPTMQILGMMKRGGIETPVFDVRFESARKEMLAQYLTGDEETDNINNEVEDAVVLKPTDYNQTV